MYRWIVIIRLNDHFVKNEFVTLSGVDSFIEWTRRNGIIIAAIDSYSDADKKRNEVKG